MTELEHKREQRKKHTAEEFTNLELVNKMLNKLPKDVFIDPSKTFLDNSAGNGNFLVVILARKLSLGHPPLQALSCIWGCELMLDNVEEMRSRLLAELPDTLTPEEQLEAQKIVNHNVVCHDALTWDFENWKSKDKKSKKLFE
jgi:hypothetical protein